LIDFVANLYLELFDHAGVGGRNFHRGLVGLDRDEGLFRFDRIAGLDQQFNDRNILKVANIGDLDFNK